MTAFPLTQPPLTIPGCAAWFDAFDTSAGAVASWRNKANSQIPAIQATGASQPICTANQLNGKNGLVFNGANYLTANGLATIMSGTDRAATVYCVSSATTVSAIQYQYLWGRSSSTAPLSGLRYENTGVYKLFRRDDATLLKEPTGGTAVANTANISSFINYGTTGSLYINNAAVITTADLDVGLTTLDVFAIGASFRGGTASLFLTGNEYELIVYPYAVTISQNTFINRYLSNKWGIAIT